MSSPFSMQSSLGKLILASASERRREILEAAGLDFEVLPTRVEERPRESEPAGEFVRRIALEKARQALAVVPPPRRSPVLGADTVVLVEGRMLGKPASGEEAKRMLRALSGKEHRVLTGVCLLCPMDRPPYLWQDIQLASTAVKFSPLAEGEIEQYVATGEPLDKAGAYAIQGLASKYVEWIHGCYFNVVGLPISLVYEMLKRLASAIQETGE